MEYFIPAILFLIVGAVLAILITFKALDDGDAPFAADAETPLGDTNEHSDVSSHAGAGSPAASPSGSPRTAQQPLTSARD